MPRSPDDHPTSEILAAFAQGRGLIEDLTGLEEHIAGCQECTSILESLESDSGLAQRVGAAVNNKIAASPAEVPLTFLEPSPRPGALGRIGHYDVLEVLGRGGFGIVLKAFDDSLQRVVALKVLLPELSATSPARKRFLREARAAAGIRHENVVQIYSVSEQPVPYLVMEYIPGESLQQRLARTGPLEAGDVADIGRQIASGLAVAHAQGLVHRDIKPANVMLDSALGQRVKITDFGLARAVDDASLTHSGIVAGTPLYMAPEQARGEALDHRTDLFSLGSVLYETLTGRPPFRAPSTVAVLKRVCEDTPRPIHEIMPDAPESLCRIISRLHAKLPADRIQTAQQVVDALSSGSSGKPSFRSTEKSGADPRRLIRGRRWVAVGLAMLVVSILIVINQQQPANRTTGDKQASASIPPAQQHPAELPKTISSKVSAGPQQPSSAGLNPVPRPAAGPDGMALQFNGKTSHVHVATLSRDDLGPATLEAWVRPEFRPNPHLVALVAGKSVLQLTQSYRAFFPVETNTRLTRGDAENPQFVSGQWVHVAVVVDDREVRVYMNGQKQLQIERNAAAVHPAYVYGGLWLGAQPHPHRPDQIAFHFLGLLDEIRVSNVARYGENFVPATRFSPDTNTLALYHCDEGAGAELHDASGNKHLGKVVDVAWVESGKNASPSAISLIQGDETAAQGESEGSARWRVSNQVLLGEASGRGTSKLSLGRHLPARFRLRCEAKVIGNSGIDVNVHVGGVALQGYHVELADKRSGSIGQVIGWKWLARREDTPEIEGNWTTIEIRVDEKTLTSYINERQIATVPIPEHEETEIKLELDVNPDPSTIEVRKLELLPF